MLVTGVCPYLTNIVISNCRISGLCVCVCVCVYVLCVYACMYVFMYVYLA